MNHTLKVRRSRGIAKAICTRADGDVVLGDTEEMSSTRGRIDVGADVLSNSLPL